MNRTDVPRRVNIPRRCRGFFFRIGVPQIVVGRCWRTSVDLRSRVVRWCSRGPQ